MTVIVVIGRLCVHRVLCWATGYPAPVVIVGGARVPVESVPVVVFVRARLCVVWLSCRFVVVEGKSEGGCLFIVVVLSKVLSKIPSSVLSIEAMAAKPSVSRLFVFLTLYVAFAVPVL
ncbi:MAG: hypothetical protein L0I84_06320 [Halomonas subglaciescola]|nr:hypothetical protein [Halomonas subglaciescola]